MKEEEEGTSNMEDKIEVEAIDKDKKVEDIKAETTIEISKEEVVTEEEIKGIDRVAIAEEIEEIEEIEMVDKTIIEETMMSRASEVVMATEVEEVTVLEVEVEAVLGTMTTIEITTDPKLK